MHRFASGFRSPNPSVMCLPQISAAENYFQKSSPDDVGTGSLRHHYNYAQRHPVALLPVAISPCAVSQGWQRPSATLSGFGSVPSE